MCEINEMLNNFMHTRNLKGNDLRYRYSVNAGGTTFICSDEGGISYHEWQQNGEGGQEEVLLNINATYDNWHKRLRDEPEPVVKEILNWGFGERYDDDRRKLVRKHIDSIRRLLDQREQQCDTILFRRKDNPFSESWRNIASWSKVLAAFAPERYFIYDSRVAVALNIISSEEWYLPEEHGHSIVFAFIKQEQSTRPTVKGSYLRYCESLRQRGGARLERSLFMLGKMLDFPCGDWRNRISVNTELVNR